MLVYYKGSINKVSYLCFCYINDIVIAIGIKTDFYVSFSQNPFAHFSTHDVSKLVFYSFSKPMNFIWLSVSSGHPSKLRGCVVLLASWLHFCMGPRTAGLFIVGCLKAKISSLNCLLDRVFIFRESCHQCNNSSLNLNDQPYK